MTHIEKSDILKLVDALRCNSNIVDELEGLSLDSIRKKLLNERVEQHTTSPEKQPTKEQKKVNKAITFIENNFQNEISIEEIASIAHLSMFHFSRIFKKTTGQSPHQYLIQQRMKEAKKLLSHTNKPIGIIANETGYNNASGFSASFKHVVGVSPKEYRKI